MQEECKRTAVVVDSKTGFQSNEPSSAAFWNKIADKRLMQIGGKLWR